MKKSRTLSGEEELARVKNLALLHKLYNQMKELHSHFKDADTGNLSDDMRYIKKLIGRFMRKEWFYFPKHKKQLLNGMWKEYK